MWDGFWFVASKKQWDRLPADLKAIVSRNVDMAADEQRVEYAVWINRSRANCGSTAWS